MSKPDNSNWMSILAGSAISPPRRETLQDLIDSRPFFEEMADLDDLPDVAQFHERVVIRDDPTPLAAEIYVPSGPGPFPVILHIHGGGWCVGSSRSDRKIGLLAATRGYVVVSPDYRLAPENPFPAAVEDCLYAAQWVARSIRQYHGDPNLLVLEGGSAGANLAVASLLASRLRSDEIEHSGDPVSPVALLLYYGAYSFPKLLLEPGSNVGSVELWARGYLGKHFSTKLHNPLASPVYSNTLSDLPPTYLSCGADDSFLGHTLEFAGALAAASVPVRVSVVEGLDHGFVKMTSLLEDAASEVERSYQWLGRRIAEAAERENRRSPVEERS